MRPLKTLFAIALLLAAAGCVTLNPAPPRISPDYAGADGGWLVVALGAAPGTQYQSYTLRFRKPGGSAEGAVRYFQGGRHKGARDFDGPGGNGVVDVQRLPPGDYEIFSVGVYFDGSVVESSYVSRRQFSLPFSIRPGRATYIGDFSAVPVTRPEPQLGVRIGLIDDSAAFMLSDKQARDLPIAKKKVPAIKDIVVAIPDAAGAGSSYIRSGAAP